MQKKIRLPGIIGDIPIIGGNKPGEKQQIENLKNEISALKEQIARINQNYMVLAQQRDLFFKFLVVAAEQDGNHLILYNDNIKKFHPKKELHWNQEPEMGATIITVSIAREA